MLSLILPVRDWSIERVRYCIRSFIELKSQLLTEIIVVDFGSAEPVALPDLEPLVRVVRLEAEIWSLSEAINAGVLSAANDVLAKTDADILIGAASGPELERLCAAIHSGRLGLAMAQATDLPPDLDVASAYDLVRNDREPAGRLRPKWGQGGLVLFGRDTWDAIGGFDSRFTGWGNEDNDFAERVRRSGRRTQWADRQRLTICHVWHPPSYAATGVVAQRRHNQKIAKDDHSIFRSVKFRHSNFDRLAAPAVMSSVSPLVTLAVATTGRPGRERMIAEAINSFRGQADNDFEVVVVDNGSTWEETAQLRHALAQLDWIERLQIEAQPEASIPRARNAISSIAKGRYICVVDDDDIALPNRLADHLRVFESQSGAHGSHGGWIDFDESTGLIERNSGKNRSIATLLKGSGKITAHPASLYRADVMRAVPYDENFALGSDFDLALRLANNGFDVPHTSSYLTLRRYHSSNVTITGQSNQVSNGAAARSRTLASFDWQHLQGLEQRAKAHDGEVYCRNQMSLETLSALVPAYVGVWHVFVPIDGLMGMAPEPALPTLTFGSVPTDSQIDLGLSAHGFSSGPALPPGQTTQLQRLLDLVDGEICTRRSGINQAVYFRSDPIDGLAEACRIKAEVEAITRNPVSLASQRQSEIDRSVAFDWRQVRTGTGERLLKSNRFDDLMDLLNVISALGRDTILTSALSILSDYDDAGEAYYLITSSIKGIENLQRLEFDLQRHLRIPFSQVAANGAPSDLVPNSRAY
jgi:glycosyltransferase involved in cell wall biosynthesis